ncbi:MAG: vanadium-dependent haloperoxidase [Ferruginibacter sp.]|nr:vanadium-dependent haloperoxidase [Ferruginibacter sp.]
MRFFFIILLFPISSVYAQERTSDALTLHRAQKALTAVIVHDIFSPPVASRIYAYANIAAYEVLVKEHKGYHSLQGQVKTFPAIPNSAAKIYAPLAAVQAFLLTGKSLVFSEKMLEDSATQVLDRFKRLRLSPQVYNASLRYGKQVADSVMKWASKDKYRETRSLRRYNYSKQEGKWMPTPPSYMAAVEPYWNRIRPMLLDSCTQFRAVVPPTFSTDKKSAFYAEALEVYTSTKQLTAGQKAIASFWDCNPFAVTTEGHLNFAAKKISPGGHWMSIAAVACQTQQADIMKSAAVYTLTAIALFDGFIICWDEKYRSNVIRPETFINKYMDEDWRPLLQTPPFPEYSSGHSVVSTAAATVLTECFGNNFEYEDDTEVEFGLPVKHFTSFKQACDEAAISRLYGGIHYRSAIEQGQVQGSNLGKWIIKRIKLM